MKREKKEYDKLPAGAYGRDSSCKNLFKMFKAGYTCPICGSTDTVFYDGGDDDEEFFDESEDIDLIVECEMCGYLFIPKE